MIVLRDLRNSLFDTVSVGSGRTMKGIYVYSGTVRELCDNLSHSEPTSEHDSALQAKPDISKNFATGT